LGPTLLSLDPVSSSYRETAASTSRSEGGAHYGICDCFCVRTILFQTLYVVFVVRHANREILHAAVTPYPTAEWAAEQIVECCAWDRWPLRFLIHDCDSRYGATFERRLRQLGVKQVRTPFRAPRANAISERWVKSVRTEYLDHLFIFSEDHLRRAVSSHVTYFNCSRPHRSLDQQISREVPRDRCARCRAANEATDRSSGVSE
jgi:putative transposase